MHDFRFKATQGAISSVIIRSLSEVLNQDFLQGLLRSVGMADIGVIPVANLMGDEAFEDRIGPVRVFPPVSGVPWERYLESDFAALLTQSGGGSGVFRLRLMGAQLADIQVDTEVPYRDDTDRQQRPSTNRLRPVVPLDAFGMMPDEADALQRWDATVSDQDAVFSVVVRIELRLRLVRPGEVILRSSTIPDAQDVFQTLSVRFRPWIGYREDSGVAYFQGTPGVDSIGLIPHTFYIHPSTVQISQLNDIALAYDFRGVLDRGFGLAQLAGIENRSWLVGLLIVLRYSLVAGIAPDAAARVVQETATEVAACLSGMISCDEFEVSQRGRRLAGMLQPVPTWPGSTPRPLLAFSLSTVNEALAKLGYQIVNAGIRLDRVVFDNAPGFTQAIVVRLQYAPSLMYSANLLAQAEVAGPNRWRHLPGYAPGLAFREILLQASDDVLREWSRYYQQPETVVSIGGQSLWLEGDLAGVVYPLLSEILRGPLLHSLALEAMYYTNRNTTREPVTATEVSGWTDYLLDKYREFPYLVNWLSARLGIEDPLGAPVNSAMVRAEIIRFEDALLSLQEVAHGEASLGALTTNPAGQLFLEELPGVRLNQVVARQLLGLIYNGWSDALSDIESRAVGEWAEQAGDSECMMRVLRYWRVEIAENYYARLVALSRGLPGKVINPSADGFPVEPREISFVNVVPERPLPGELVNFVARWDASLYCMTDVVGLVRARVYAHVRLTPRIVGGDLQLGLEVSLSLVPVTPGLVQALLAALGPIVAGIVAVDSVPVSGRNLVFSENSVMILPSLEPLASSLNGFMIASGLPDGWSIQEQTRRFQIDRLALAAGEIKVAARVQIGYSGLTSLLRSIVIPGLGDLCGAQRVLPLSDVLGDVLSIPLNPTRPYVTTLALSVPSYATVLSSLRLLELGAVTLAVALTVENVGGCAYENKEALFKVTILNRTGRRVALNRIRLSAYPQLREYFYGRWSSLLVPDGSPFPCRVLAPWETLRIELRRPIFVLHTELMGIATRTRCLPGTVEEVSPFTEDEVAVLGALIEQIKRLEREMGSLTVSVATSEGDLAVMTPRLLSPIRRVLAVCQDPSEESQAVRALDWEACRQQGLVQNNKEEDDDGEEIWSVSQFPEVAYPQRSEKMEKSLPDWEGDKLDQIDRFDNPLADPSAGQPMPQPMQLSDIFDALLNAQAVSTDTFSRPQTDKTVTDAQLGKPGHGDPALVSQQKAKPNLADAKPTMQAAYSGEWSVDNARNDPSPRMFNIHHAADISKAKLG